MARFIVLLVLFLALGSVRSEESQDLRKINRHKFLLDLLKRLRKVRSHEKSVNSQAISPNQINVSKNRPSTIESQISQNRHITNKITYEKKSQERSNVIKPAKARKSIGRRWKNLNQLVKTSKTDVLLDLLKTLKRIRSHEGVRKTISLPNSSVIPQPSLLQNVSAFIASHSQLESENDFSDVSTKFEQRANVIKPVISLDKVSESQESKARYSYALARMSFLEQLERAQEEKLNKLSKLEKEFSGILLESAGHDVTVNSTSGYLLQNRSKLNERTGIPLDKMQKPESTKQDIGVGKTSGIFNSFLPNKLKKHRLQRVRAQFVDGGKKTSLRRDHMITPWSQVGSHISGSLEQSSEGSTQNVRRFQSNFKALMNEYRAAKKSEDKSNILALLRRLHQKILLDFNGKKTTSKVNYIQNKNQLNKWPEFFSGAKPEFENKRPENRVAPLTHHSDPVKHLPQKSPKNENTVYGCDENVNGEGKNIQRQQYSNTPISTTQNISPAHFRRPFSSNKFYNYKNQKIATAKPHSDKYMVHDSVGTPQYHMNDDDLRATLHHNQHTPKNEYQKNESKNKNGPVKSRSNLMPRILNKTPDNLGTLSSDSSKNKLSNDAVTTQFKIDGNLPQENSVLGENIGNFKEGIKENHGRQSTVTQGMQSSITLAPSAAQSNPQSFTAPQYTNTHKVTNQMVTPHLNTISSKANENALGNNKENQKKQYSLSSLKLPTQNKHSASYSSLSEFGNEVATPRIERLHQTSINNNQVDIVKSSSFSNKYKLGNETTTKHHKIDGSSVQHSLDDTNGISGIYGINNGKNNGNPELESSTGAILQNQNKSPENLSSSFNSNELRLGVNQNSNLESKTDHSFPPNSPIHKNSTSGAKLTVALQKAQGIFLEKVKEIVAGHHKNDAVQKINFGDSKKQDNGKHNPDENIIKSSAYVMDESPATKPVPKKETNENSGIVPPTPTNPMATFPVGNIASPPMQLPNLGFDATRQPMGQLNSGSSPSIQSPGAVTPFNYAEQEQAHEEERIASQQEREFQNIKNGASSFNGENVPYQAPISTGLNQPIPGMHYPLPNAGFRPPNVDDLDEYRGGMERYQLSHNIGLGNGVDDLGDRPLRRTHLHRYSQGDDDNDEDDDEDEGDDDDFDDGKKKSHIRKPKTLDRKKHLKGLIMTHKQKPTAMREMKHPFPSTRSYVKKHLTRTSTKASLKTSNT